MSTHRTVIKHKVGTVDAEIQGRFCAVRLRLDGLAFVGRDRAPLRFSGPLDLLGVDGEPGQLVLARLRLRPTRHVDLGAV